VAGVAALLIHRNPALRSWPEASRAIIMAAAVHNIEGPSNIPTGTDQRDGAGGIDAKLADVAATTGNPGSAAVCAVPCWWSSIINNSTFPVGTYMYRDFMASRGERVRVAISWWANANCPDCPSCDLNSSRLDTNLDLLILDPTGAQVPGGYSVSYDNNYELVDFVATLSGEYKIGVYKRSATESANSLGIAWVKDATYLPDLANEAAAEGHAWVSELYIRNEAPLPRTVSIYYNENNGTATPKGSDTCYLAPNQSCQIPMDQAINGLYRIRPGARGSAIVQGSEDVTVQVFNTHQPAPYTADSYTGIAQASAILRAPIICHNNYGWQTDFTIQNPNSQADYFQVIYDPWSGTNCTTAWLPIPANGNYNVNQLGWPSCGLSSPFVGGARIVSQSGRPLAGVAFEWKYVNSASVSRTSYELFPQGANPAFVPLLQRNSYGINDGAAYQDASGNAANLVWSYYWQSGAACSPGSAPYGLGANSVYHAYPAPPDGACVPAGSTFVGAAQVNRDNGNKFMGVVNQVVDNSNLAMSYAMPSSGARTVIVPIVMRAWANWRGRSNWTTGLAIQNTTGNPAQVTVKYYDSLGNLQTAPGYPVPAHGAVTIYPAPGNITPFSGSAVITSDQPIAAIANYISTGTDDTGMSITGINR
jgi:hypothetical protein